MRKKLTYESPEAELLVVRFEDNILSTDSQFGEGGNVNDHSDDDDFWNHN